MPFRELDRPKVNIKEVFGAMDLLCIHRGIAIPVYYG